MTDTKSWLWRKKSSDKTVIVAEKEDLASRKHEEEIQDLLAEKAYLERDVRELGSKISSALSECTAKDDQVKKHAKTAKEALAGWEKAEAKSLSLRQELNEVVKQRDICEDRTHHLDSALKECMQQLRFVREDQEQRIHDVLLKSSEELEETKMFFEEKLEESAEKIAKLNVENFQLGEILSLKEQLIEDLNHSIAKSQNDVNSLLARLENMEKDNNSLRYEVRVLEKEVDIRNEEKEFNRRTADATQKNHLENVRKIAKLESECQRLRVLVRKRLPGPADLAKMKSEVNILHKKSNLSASQLDFGVKSYSESPGKKINFLNDKILALEDENNFLRETLQKHLNELQISRNMYLQAATKLSQVEAQLEELPKHDLIKDVKNIRMSHDLSLASMSDVGSDDKSVSMSDINHFMDDFAEMEKLALVCVDNPTDKFSVSKKEFDMNSFSEITGKELVPVSEVVDCNANSKRPFPSALSTSLLKLMEIIEGVSLTSEDYDNLSPKGSVTQTGYFVRVFQWKASELAVILQNLLGTCHELLNGEVNFETFTQELTFALEWIIDHCFSLNDVSIMKNDLKKQFGWDETRTESENEAGLFGQLKEQLQSKGLFESTVTSMQVEFEGLKKSKAEIEDQFENNVMTIEALNVQLLAVKCEMQEAHHNFTALKGELFNTLRQCEDLEAKCLDLQVQLESATKMGTSQHPDHDKKKLETEWEISAASEKLAECQETILHLGKQLKAMSTSRDIMVSDKFMSTPADSKIATNVSPITNAQKLTNQRSSLFDQMQADDDSGIDQLDQSPETKEIISAQNCNSENNSLAIVPYKKQEVPSTTSSGLFKKLLWRKKKSSNKKLQVPFAV